MAQNESARKVTPDGKGGATVPALFENIRAKSSNLPGKPDRFQASWIEN